jgi:hypothetical protein
VGYAVLASHKADPLTIIYVRQGIYEYKDRTYPENVREKVSAISPEPECKNPLNLSYQLGGRYQSSGGPKAGVGL